MLWSSGHYDGPCSGIAKGDDNKYYFFDLLGSPEARNKRAYALHPITKVEFFEEFCNHLVFWFFLGDYTTYKNGKRGVKSRPWKKIGFRICLKTKCYGIDSKKSRLYSKRTPIGYFVRE